MKWKILLALFLISAGAALGAWAGRVPYAHWQAKAAMSDYEFDQANGWLSRAEQWSPSNATTQFLFARLARKQADMDKVTAYLGKAVALGYPSDLVQRAQCLAMAQQGNLAFAMPKLESLLIDQRGEGPEICDAYVQGFIKMRQFSGAQDLLNAWISDHPEDPRPLYIRSTLHREFSRWEKAEEDLRKALELLPDKGEFLLALGTVLLTRQEPEQALEAFQAAQKDPLSREEGLVGEVRCLRMLGKTEESEAKLKALLGAEPSNRMYLYELARTYSETGKYKEVITLMEPLVKEFPRNSEYHYVLGTALFSAGRHEEGREHLDRAQTINTKVDLARNIAEEIKPDEDSVEDRYTVGMLHMEYGKEQEGLIWLFSILNLRPDHLPTLKALAAYYQSKAAEGPAFAELAKKFADRIPKEPEPESKPPSDTSSSEQSPLTQTAESQR